MNQQQNQPGPAGNNVNFLPPPRQEMEYLCAGMLLYDLVTNINQCVCAWKTVVLRMTSSLESLFAAENVDTASCTRKERNEVSSPDIHHRIIVFVLVLNVSCDSGSV